MEYTDTLEQAVKRAVSGIAPILDLPIPDDHKFNEACAAARSYTVKQTGKKKAAPKPPRYFALIPEIDLERLVGDKMHSKQASKSGLQLWSHLVAEKRLPEHPHVTVLHMKEKHESEKLWECCLALRKSTGEIDPIFKLTFDHIVWNANVMALSVSELKFEHTESENEHRRLGEAVIERMPEAIVRRLHLTVGTRDDTINPFEAASMIAEWRSGRGNDVQSMRLDKCVVRGKFTGRYS
jgi:tRNA ligase